MANESESIVANKYNQAPVERYKMTAAEIEAVLDKRDKIISDLDKRFSEVFFLKLGNPVIFEMVAV
jgi:enoyl reductase-like protein